MSIELKIGILGDADVLTGDRPIIYTPHMVRVSQNKERIFGKYSVSVFNKSDFPITIDEVGFAFDDGSAMRLTEVEGSRIESRDVIEFKGSISSLMDEPEIGDATHLFVKSVCGAHANSEQLIVEAFIHYLSTQSWPAQT